jgi:hypothetical protein
MQIFQRSLLVLCVGLLLSPAAQAMSVDLGTITVGVQNVPEINPVWSAFGSLLVAAALILRHSAKFRK